MRAKNQPIPDTGGQRIVDYLARLSSAEPAPGGGSASAIVAAMGCALGEMVCNISLVKISPRTDDHGLCTASELFARDRQRLIELSGLDELAFPGYLSAKHLSKSSDEERLARAIAINDALVFAAEVPLEVATVAVESLGRLPIVAEYGTRHALSDVSTAAHLLEAATHGALENANVNLRLLRDDERAIDLHEQLDAIHTQIAAAKGLIAHVIASRSPVRPAG